MANFLKLDTEKLKRSTEETKKEILLKANEFIKSMAIDSWRFVTANSLNTGISFGSPVLSGQYYTNHRISVGTVNQDVNYLANPDPDQPVSGLPLTIARGALASFKLGDRIFIANSLPYAQRIEDGWSRLKAPEGVYSVAADRISAKYSGKRIL